MPVEAQKPVPALTIYIGIDDQENSIFLKQELQRNWNPYRYHHDTFYSPWYLKEEHKKLDPREVVQLLGFHKVQQKIFSRVNVIYVGYDDVTPGTELPAIKFRKNGAWNTLDKKAFTTTGFPLKTIEWQIDLFFIDEIRQKYQEKVNDLCTIWRVFNDVQNTFNRELIFARNPEYVDYFYNENCPTSALYVFDPKQKDWILISKASKDEFQSAILFDKIRRDNKGYRFHTVSEKINMVSVTSPTDKDGKIKDIQVDLTGLNIWLRPEPFPVLDDYEPPAPWEKPIKVIPNIYQDELQENFIFESKEE